MQNLQVIDLKGQRVLTTRQLAEAYGTEVKVIQNNFQRNKDRYVAGKHYIYMDRDELREVKTTHPQIKGELKRASRMHFWTEKGTLLHAKSLNTDKAWEVYDYLVDFYFRVKEERKQQTYREIREAKIAEKQQQNLREVVDIPENPKVLKAIQKLRDDLTCMDILLQNCIRYTSEKTYIKMRSMTAEVIPIIVEDWNKLFETKPKLIQKPY